jgi:hypothetical protein
MNNEFELIDDDFEEQCPEPDSWEQYFNESAKAYKALCVYRDMGSTRSLAKTAKAMNHPPGYKQTLWNWSTKYEWQSRCLDYDRHMEKMAQFEKENIVREMTNRHACDAIKIQQIAMEALERISLEATPLRDLIRMWEGAMRAERASRGLPAEPTKANYVDYSDAMADHYKQKEFSAWTSKI